MGTVERTYAGLPKQMYEELFKYIDEGNDKGDLIDLYLESLSDEALGRLILEVARSKVPDKE